MSCLGGLGMQGYVLSEVWGKAVSQWSMSRRMRWTWSGFKGNEVWTLKKNIVEVERGRTKEGVKCKSVMQKYKWGKAYLYKNEEVKPSEKTGMRELNSFSFRGNTQFPELCWVHLFGLVFKGFGPCHMATGSSSPPPSHSTPLGLQRRTWSF